MLKFKVSAMTEPLNLSWEQFSDHLQLMSRELFKADKYSDVTIVCDDQIQFKAHKIILSACSPVFKNIIDNNPSKHPLIYLRGIESQEMESILQFMYLGEGKFYQERLGEFLKVGKNLEVAGISISSADETEDNTEIIDAKDYSTERLPKKEIKTKNQEGNIENNLLAEEVTVSSERSSKEEEKYVDSENETDPLRENKAFNKHYKCNQCEYKSTSQHNLLKHKESVHDGVKYQCDQCDHKSTQKVNLERHIKAKHTNVKIPRPTNVNLSYPCEQCGYEAKSNNNLRKHVEAVHDGVKYLCDQCDHKSTQKVNLQRHIQAVHEGIKYPCIHCLMQFSDKATLKRHIKTKHEAEFE